MKNTVSLFITKHWYAIGITIILVTAFILRFTNYSNRWGLAYDQARDVIVAREAIRTFTIPLVGPFSSAGQFVYGPQWFWIIALMSLFYIHSFLTPWIIQTMLYVLMVAVVVLIGNELFGKAYGLVVGSLAAVSPAQIQQSVNLTSPSIISIFSILSVYCFVLFLKNRSEKYLLFMGFCVGTAINVHFQSVGLLTLFPIALIFGKYSKRLLLFLILGFLLPFIPLLFFDFRSNFFESKNIIDYFLHGQYNIYIPKRWLTYAGSFLPLQWSRIISGNIFFGYLTMILVSAYFAYDTLHKRLNKQFLALGISFFLMIVMLRYYRGESYDSYLVFLHPFILLLSAYAIRRLYHSIKFAGIILLLALVVTSVQKTWSDVRHAENFTAFLAKYWIHLIAPVYPGKKFAMYDFGYTRRDKTLPMVLFLDEMGKIDDNGTKIGLIISTSEVPPPHPLVLGDKGGYQFYDLSSSSSAELSKEGWAFVNPSEVYKSTQDWYKK